MQTCKSSGSTIATPPTIKTMPITQATHQQTSSRLWGNKLFNSRTRWWVRNQLFHNSNNNITMETTRVVLISFSNRIIKTPVNKIILWHNLWPSFPIRIYTKWIKILLLITTWLISVVPTLNPSNRHRIKPSRIRQPCKLRMKISSTHVDLMFRLIMIGSSRLLGD